VVILEKTAVSSAQTAGLVKYLRYVENVSSEENGDFNIRYRTAKKISGLDFS
jgi:hypothetical protein